jgi:hypothetical protein
LSLQARRYQSQVPDRLSSGIGVMPVDAVDFRGGAKWVQELQSKRHRAEDDSQSPGLGDGRILDAAPRVSGWRRLDHPSPVGLDCHGSACIQH